MLFSDDKEGIKKVQAVQQLINNLTKDQIVDKFYNFLSCVDDPDKLRLFRDVLGYLNTFNLDFKNYVLYKNCEEFWNEMFVDPSDAIQQLGKNYNLKDKYIYENSLGLYDSCATLNDIYTNSTISQLLPKLAQVLKDHVNDIDNVDFSLDVEDVLTY